MAALHNFLKANFLHIGLKTAFCNRHFAYRGGRAYFWPPTPLFLAPTPFYPLTNPASPAIIRKEPLERLLFADVLELVDWLA